MTNTQIKNGKPFAPNILILAHGAGKGMDSEFMDHIAEGVGSETVEVIRFEFPYMQKQRELGKKRPPNGIKILLQHYKDQIKGCRNANIFIGGKSMGGRIASMIADEMKVTGLICLGYPFHPPGRPEKKRTAHLLDLETPTLVLQGERDPFGKREEVLDYPLSKTITLHWIPDGEHSFKARKSSGTNQKENCDRAVIAIKQFIQDLS